MQNIMNQLQDLFKDSDSKILENNIKYHVAKRVELHEYKRTDYRDDYKKYGLDLYKILHNRFGGKSWYTLYNERSAKDVEDFVKKNQAAIVEKRTARIAKKLSELGVESVNDVQVLDHDSQGFDIVADLMASNGVKKLIIETIYAGGYNIQCLHRRTLVKVK